MTVTVQQTQAQRISLPDEVLSSGTMVDHYRVNRAIGRGGMGEVYLARDTVLGRKVALKMVQTGVLGSETAMAQFLLEAKATAQFNHPHIVTLYGAGEYNGRPYAALEYLEGQNLRERMNEERLGLLETLRIGLAIAEALQEAHARRILHRDLKPENILLPRDGRPRVLDFGLAKIVHPDAVNEADTLNLQRETFQIIGTKEMLETHEGAIRGTPMYMAPEQWTERECTGATDLWALGVILYELVSGGTPFDAPTVLALCAEVCANETAPRLPDAEKLPEPLVSLVARCLAKSQEERPTAEEAADTLRRLIYQDRAPMEVERSPFRGLLPLTERHSDRFFGREEEVAEFLERLRTEPMLPVVGPSGVGKSSFVQAGVIPRLKEQGAWVVLSLRPGRAPFEALVTRLARTPTARTTAGAVTPSQQESRFKTADVTLPAEILEKERTCLRELEEEPGRLALHLQRVAEQENARVLLFIDQLEELFTLVDDAPTRERFMTAITRAADDPEGPVRVVFTLRDDFLSKVASGASGRQALSRITVLRGLSGEALTEILNNLIATTSYKYDDPALVNRMVAEVAGEPAALPLLQFAGQMLWERRDRKGRRLEKRVYEEIGGVVGALAHHAEGIMDGLSPEEIRIARHIFLRLVTEEFTKRVVQRSRLLHGLPDRARDVLGKLVETRAITIRKGRRDQKGDAEVELVHEALIRAWGRLARWIEESRDDIGFLTEIGTAADLWERRGRRAEEVWQGEALYDALRKSERMSIVPETVHRFLTAGQRREKRRTRKRRLFVSGAFAVLLLVAGALAFQVRQANRLRQVAEQERREAEEKRAEALREGAKTALIRGHLVEARAKLRLAMETQDSPFGRALWWRLRDNPTIWKKQLGTQLTTVAFDPGGERVAAAGRDGFIYLLDIKTRATEILTGKKGEITSLDFSPDGTRLASGTASGLVGVWQLESGRVEFIRAHDQAVTGLAFHPVGKWLVSAGGDGAIKVWNTLSGEQTSVLRGHVGRVESIHFDPKGRMLASGGTDRSVRIWDWNNRREKAILKGHNNTISDVRFSKDGRYLVSGSWDRTARVWDVSAGRTVTVLRGHNDTVEGVDFSPDDKRVVTGSSDRSLRLWDAASGKELQLFTGHTDFVYAARFSPAADVAVSVGSDGSARLFEASPDAKPSLRHGHKGAVVGVDFSPDGGQVVTSSTDRTIRFWDVASGAERQISKGHAAGLGQLAFSPNGRILASTGGYDNLIRLWDAASGAERPPLKGHGGPVTNVAWGEQGQTLISGSKDGTVRQWDPGNGAEIHRFVGHTGAVTDVDLFSASGLIASAGGDGSIRIWRLGETAPLEVLEGHDGEVKAVRFTPDGDHLISGGGDGSVVEWTLGSGRRNVLLEVNGQINDVAVRSDGEVIAAAVSDGTTRLLDRRKKESFALDAHRRGVLRVRFNPTGDLLATAGQDGTLRLWDTASRRPHWRAPVLLESAPGLLTHEGWHWPFDSETSPPPATAWRKYLETDACLAAGHRETGYLCIKSYNDDLSLWDTVSDARLFEARLPDINAIHTTPTGCLAVTKGGDAHLFLKDGTSTRLAGNIQAASVDEEILLAVDREVLVFKTDGRPAGSFGVNAAPTAVARIRPWLLAGFERGRIDIFPIAKQTQKPDFEFEDVPAVQVRLLEPGPAGTLIAGFANGALGIWSLENGTRLHYVRLHGAITHALYKQNRLFVATNLGDHTRLDFSVFNRNHCDLLREIWREVPVVWSGGQLTEAAPPRGHPCLP